MVLTKHSSLANQKIDKKTRPKNFPTTSNKTKKKKQKPVKPLSGCTGIALKLQERYDSTPNPYSFACSLRCRHPIHIVKSRVSSAVSTRNDDWISEDIYKRYTETDSRPLSPSPPEHGNFSRRSASVPRARSTEHRKCATPEPETKPCQFHQRRVLILDLRRVKSVDAITRQNSLTGTSIDSTYADDDDGDNRSSSANPESSSIFHQLSPRNLSLSRSTTPKASTTKLNNNRRKRKSKERSASPLIYERSSSPKILEGPSPRSLSQAVPETNVPVVISARQKKLRRHGRKVKGETETSETDNNSTRRNSPRREGSAVSRTSQGDGTRKKEIVDDPHDTQMSAMSQNDDEVIAEDKTDEVTAETFESIADLNAKRLQAYLAGSARTLHHELDEQLVGTEWNSTEMECIDDKIKALQDEVKKYHTKFKAGNIRMKEDLWLSLPRTWSRSSATFGVPTDLRILQKMLPVEYVEKYIFISEPRKHLYSLVFQRYRTMENPTGKTITYRTAQRALTEVSGRPLTPEESSRLQHTFFQVEPQDFEVTESLFRGIGAVCERIFGKYSLEECDNCLTCLKYQGKDKTRCHKNQKSQIERVDFEYVAGKIRDGRVQPQLAELLQAVFDRG